MKNLIFLLLLILVTSVYSQDGNILKKATDISADTIDNRLDNLWALEKFKGDEINKELFKKTKPYIEIKILQNRLGGNTGCNEFSVSTEIKGNKIIIGSDFTQTKMACDDRGFESDFVQAIKDKTYEYNTDGLKLYFSEGDKVIMEFHKID
jgi:heat shock protein HslJ